MNLWEQARAGDENAVLAIIQRAEKSIYAAMYKYAYRPFDTEELYAQGVLLVLECIQDYCPDRGVPFLAYVHTRLKYYYLQSRAEKRHLSLDAPLQDVEEATLLDSLEAEEDTEEAFLYKERKEAIQKAMEQLTKRERKCAEGYYFHHLSLSEIADSLGIAYRTAYNNKIRALKKLRTLLADYAEDYRKETKR